MTWGQKAAKFTITLCAGVMQGFCAVKVRPGQVVQSEGFTRSGELCSWLQTGKVLRWPLELGWADLEI